MKGELTDMKHGIFITFLLIIIITVISCTANSVDDPVMSNTSSLSEEKNAAQTGYPKGQVQQIFVFVNETLYISADEAPANALPDNYIKYGNVQNDDPYNVPSTDLSAAHIEVGSVIYISDSDDAIFVSDQNDNFRKFIPY